MVYIQKGLTLEYTSQTLNLFNSHSFFNVGLTHCFFFLRILSINTHTQGERRGERKECFLKKFIVVYIQKDLTLRYVIYSILKYVNWIFVT